MVGKSGRFILRLLHIPPLFKVLLAIGVISALLALAGAVTALHHVQALLADPHYDLIALFVVVNVVVTLILGFWVMKAVLAPLDHLEAAADDIARGKHRHAAPSLLGDERLDRLAATFEEMQDTHVSTMKPAIEGVCFLREDPAFTAARI